MQLAEEIEKPADLPKQRGRPKIQNELARLVRQQRKRKQPSPGRPIAKYYQHSAIEINEIVEKLGSDKLRTEWADAPRTLRDRLRLVLFVLHEKYGGYHDPLAIERALRRLTKASKEGHNS